MRVASVILLLIPVSSGFHTPCPRKFFSRVNRLAAEQEFHQNEDGDGLSTDSRRDFMSTTATAAAATIMTFLPSERASAGESTRDIFRKPELVAARKARVQAIEDEKQRVIQEEEDRLAEIARIAAEKIAAEKRAAAKEEEEKAAAAAKIVEEKAAADKKAADKKGKPSKKEKKPSKKEKKPSKKEKKPSKKEKKEKKEKEKK